MDKKETINNHNSLSKQMRDTINTGVGRDAAYDEMIRQNPKSFNPFNQTCPFCPSSNVNTTGNEGYCADCGRIWEIEKPADFEPVEVDGVWKPLSQMVNSSQKAKQHAAQGFFFAMALLLILVVVVVIATQLPTFLHMATNGGIIVNQTVTPTTATQTLQPGGSVTLNCGDSATVQDSKGITLFTMTNVCQKSGIHHLEFSQKTDGLTISSPSAWGPNGINDQYTVKYKGQKALLKDEYHPTQDVITLADFA